MLKRLLLTLGILAGLLAPAYSAGLYPLSRQQQTDANGKPLSGARLFVYDGGTGTPRTTYKDLALTSAHPNPIVADSQGRLPLIYLADGFYRQRLTTSAGVLVFDDDGIPVLTTSAGGAGTTVDPNAILKARDFKLRFDDQPLAGYVRCNGRTIGSATSGATERANADTQSLFEELWTFANISVVSGKGASAAADWAANKQLTLPNCAGRGMVGPDDMGAGAQSVLTSTTCTNPTLIGSSCGSQVVTLGQAHLPSYTLSGGTASSVTASGTTSGVSNDHTHTFSGTTSGVSVNHVHNEQIPNALQVVQSGTGASVYQFGSLGNQSSGVESADHTHTFSGTTSGHSASHTHTVTVTGTASGVSISSGGSGTGLPNLPPVMTMMIYIRL